MYIQAVNDNKYWPVSKFLTFIEYTNCTIGCGLERVWDLSKHVTSLTDNHCKLKPFIPTSTTPAVIISYVSKYFMKFYIFSMPSSFLRCLMLNNKTVNDFCNVNLHPCSGHAHGHARDLCLIICYSVWRNSTYLQKTHRQHKPYCIPLLKNYNFHKIYI